MEMERWVVEGFLEGHIFIPENDNNLPTIHGRVKLAPYAILEQDLHQRNPMRIFLGLEIPNGVDHVYVAWQEMEAFVRAIGIEKNVPVSANIINMTNKPEKWPNGIDFLKSRNFPVKNDWTPAEHFEDIKNRVRFAGDIHGNRKLEEFDARIENLHKPILVFNKDISQLIKDYMMGLEVENVHPSLAFLYYFKVLEYVGKKEYNDTNKTMKNQTVTEMIQVMNNELNDKEKEKAKDILKTRHIASEAHSQTSKPNKHVLNVCKKMARFFLIRKINSIQI